MTRWFRIQCDGDDDRCQATLESMELTVIEDHMIEHGWVTVEGPEVDSHFCGEHAKETAA